MPDADEDEGEPDDAVGARVRDWGIWGGEAPWGAEEEVEDEWGVLM